MKTLKDVMPMAFMGGEYHDSYAYTMRDVEVVAEYRLASWPGTHKNVSFWVALANGLAVGLNENPARGWSFPVIKAPKDCAPGAMEAQDKAEPLTLAHGSFYVLGLDTQPGYAIPAVLAMTYRPFHTREEAQTYAECVPKGWQAFVVQRVDVKG
jgi:hypothetical protein